MKINILVLLLLLGTTSEIAAVDLAHFQGNVLYLVIHHSATSGGNLTSIDAAHRRRGFDMIGYDLVIYNGNGGPDGSCVSTKRYTERLQGAHALGTRPHVLEFSRTNYPSIPTYFHKAKKRIVTSIFNKFGVGICLIGKEKFTDKQLAKLRSTLLAFRKCYEGTKYQLRLVRHRDVDSTACPGIFLMHHIEILSRELKIPMAEFISYNPSHAHKHAYASYKH